ncbi:MAG: nuclear transport factor 2 family protein [Rubrivivax sp.]|nr:nuclear transport factor 2 family protein [Rubrivivax sp.]MDH5338474.1 nuclear transport factor 2 family protein [Rubrivivax sp.]
MARKPPITALGATPDELEQRFYDALRKGDIEALMAVWADDDEVVCVHPGGPRVVGPAAIRASFEAIFGNGPIPVQPEQMHRLESMAAVVHHLMERVQVNTSDGPRDAWVIATNVYVQTAQGWRLVAHHASPGSLQAPDLDAGPATLH